MVKTCVVSTAPFMSLFFYVTTILILQEWMQGAMSSVGSSNVNQQLRIVPNMLQMSRMTEAEKHRADDSRVSYIQQKLSNLPAAGEMNLHTTAAAAGTSLLQGSGLGTANYLVNVALGSPARNMTWIIDTGSDLSWTQCLPCIPCYPQRDPIFDSTASSTYSAVLCSDSRNCIAYLGPYKGDCDAAAPGSLCKYKQPYLDGSLSTGDFATDLMFIPGASSAVRFAFGCGHSNTGANFIGYSGILSLSRDILSFFYQANFTSFSYCLPDPYGSVSAVGFLQFNTTPDIAVSICSNLLYTKWSSLYLVNVSSVAVNNVALSGAAPFQIIIDSGTLITRLPVAAYVALRSAFLKDPATSLLAPAPSVSGFDTCFTQASVAAVGLSRLPSVSLSFGGSTSTTPYTVPASGLLYRPSYATSCFAFRAVTNTNSSTGILGNFQQLGRRFTFDRSKSIACVEPTGISCS